MTMAAALSCEFFSGLQDWDFPNTYFDEPIKTWVLQTSKNTNGRNLFPVTVAANDLRIDGLGKNNKPLELMMAATMVASRRCKWNVQQIPIDSI